MLTLPPLSLYIHIPGFGLDRSASGMTSAYSKAIQC